jgi:alpha-1,2-mannosyltransferase
MHDLISTRDPKFIRLASLSRGARSWLLAALIASLALLAAYQIPYTYTMDLGDARDSFFNAGFQGVEDDPSLNFRWTTPNSSLVFPGVVQNLNYLLTIRLAEGPRPASAPSPAVTLYANGTPVRTFVANGDLRTYSVKIGANLLARGPDLVLQLDVPTFVPSKTIPGSTDDRNLGVIVDHFELAPAGTPVELIAIPPMTQWLGWLSAALLWFALIIRTGWLQTARGRWAILLSGIVLSTLGLILARPWTAAVVWYVCASLALGAMFSRSFAGWLAEFRLTRRIPFGFLHTLGIANPRLRGAVELGIILILAMNYLTSIVLPLRNQVLGDFFVYYAGANVWLHGGNLYDPNQLQQFNLAQSLLKGQIGPFTSPPSALLFFAPFALLPVAEAKAAWLVFGFVLLVGSGVFLWLAVRASVPLPPSPVWLAIMFTSSQSLQDSFDFGQVNTLYSFLFALGLWAWTQRRSAVTGLAMALGAAVKVFSAIFFLYFLLKRAWRALAASIASGGVLLLVTAAITGAQTWLDYLFRILPDASEHRVSSFDQSMLVFLRRSNFLLGLLHDTDQLDKSPSAEMSLLALAVTVILLVFSAWWFTRFARSESLEGQLEFAAVIVVMMLVLPRMWEHYLMWLILPFYLILAYVANRRLTIIGQLAVLLLILLSWLLSQDSPNLFTQPGWPPALISIGLYGTFLIYLCLLYLTSRASVQETVATAKVKLEGSREAQSLSVQARKA